MDHLLFTGNAITYNDSSLMQKKLTLNLMACKNAGIQNNHLGQSGMLEVNATKMKNADLKTDCPVNLKE